VADISLNWVLWFGGSVGGLRYKNKKRLIAELFRE
jgi:hypothetical protein